MAANPAQVAQLSKDSRTFQVAVIGEHRIGKTQLIQRLTYNQFSEINDKSTSDGFLKGSVNITPYVQRHPNINIKYMLHDIDSSMLSALRQRFLNRAHVVIIVFACDSAIPYSRGCIGRYIEEAKAYAKDAKIIIAGTRKDWLDEKNQNQDNSDDLTQYSEALKRKQLHLASLQQLREQLTTYPYIECSAKTGEGLEAGGALSKALIAALNLETDLREIKSSEKSATLHPHTVSDMPSAPYNQFLFPHSNKQDVFTRDFRLIFNVLLSKKTFPDISTEPARAVQDPTQRMLRWAILAKYAELKPASRTATAIEVYKQLKSIEFNYYGSIVNLGFYTSADESPDFLNRLQNFLLYFKGNYKAKVDNCFTLFSPTCPLVQWVFNENITEATIRSWPIETARQHVIDTLCHANLYPSKNADIVIQDFFNTKRAEATPASTSGCVS